METKPEELSRVIFDSIKKISEKCTEAAKHFPDEAAKPPKRPAPESAAQPPAKKTPSMIPNKLSLQDSGVVNRLQSKLELLLQNPIPDVKIICRDGEVLVHSQILEKEFPLY